MLYSQDQRRPKHDRKQAHHARNNCNSLDPRCSQSRRSTLAIPRRLRCRAQIERRRGFPTCCLRTSFLRSLERLLWDASICLRNSDACGRSCRAGNIGARDLDNVGGCGVEVRLRHADLVIGEVVDDVGGAQECVAEKNGSCSGRHQAEATDEPRTVLEGWLAAIFEVNGCDEFAEADFDGRAASPAESEVHFCGGGAKGAREDGAELRVVDHSDSLSDGVDNTVWEVGRSRTRVENDGQS